MTNNKLPKVLVVTLYCGENEYEQCCQSVLDQVGVEVCHKRIEYLPKQEAHQALYKIFNDNREHFDYLAKLDADMAFSSRSSLKTILSKFNDEVDVVSSTVHDFLTNSDMDSFNIFSRRCYFNYDSNDALFTDQLKIDYPGAHFSYIDHARNVMHAFNPSPFQAFMFGVHRALKVVQPKVKVPRLNKSYHQRIILNNAYKNWQNSGSEHSKYALWGASLVFQGNINSPTLFQKSDYLDVFENICAKKGVNIDPRLSEKSLVSLFKVLGIKRFLASLFAQVVNKLNFKTIRLSFVRDKSVV